MRAIARYLPGITAILTYQRAWLWGDCLAGITVAAYAIPQCMAYGELAGVNPIMGLWALLPPLLVYGLLGSSPQLSVGPESTTAVMTAAAIAPIMAQQAVAQQANLTADPLTPLILAPALALLVGVVCLVAYAARLGFVGNLLSKPILTGYLAGMACIMIAGQLSKISGIPIAATNFFAVVGAFVTHLHQIHPPTLILAIAVLLFLFTLQKFWPSAPAPLLAALLGTTAVMGLHLEQQGIAVVGEIPARLPEWQWPTLPGATWQALIGSAVGIAIVGYSDNLLTARGFANRHRTTIDPNQELLALGVANLGNGCFQGFPVSSSASRTTINDSLGSKTQLASGVTFAMVVLVLLVFHPILARFPKAALGAIVIFAATKLVEIPEFIRLKRFRTSELAIALATTFGVLSTDILIGVGIAVGLSIIELLTRLARPHDGVLGTVPEMAGLHDIADWPTATTIPGLVLYRYDAPLCFANTDNFKRRALRSIALETHPVEWFILDTEAIAEIDSTAVEMLVNLHGELTERQITFGMAKVKQEMRQQLQRAGLLDLIGPENLYPTLHTAIAGFVARSPKP